MACANSLCVVLIRRRHEALEIENTGSGCPMPEFHRDFGCDLFFRLTRLENPKKRKERASSLLRK